MVNSYFVGEFARFLNQAKDVRGWTAYRLAHECGLSQVYVGRLLKGLQLPSEATILAMAPILGVAQQELVDRANADRIGGAKAVEELAERLGLRTASTITSPPPEPPGVQTRMEEAMREAGLDVAGLARALGVKHRRITQIALGEGPPVNDAELALMAEAFGLREPEVRAWFTKPTPAPTPGLVRYFGAAAAGQGLDLSEGELHHLPPAWVPPQADGYVRATGNSMRAAGIPDGAFVFVRRLADGEDPKDGAVVLANVAGQGAVIKRFRLWDGKPHLVSEATGKDAPPPIPVRGGVRVQGLVLRVATLQDVE